VQQRKARKKGQDVKPTKKQAKQIKTKMAAKLAGGGSLFRLGSLSTGTTHCNALQHTATHCNTLQLFSQLKTCVLITHTVIVSEHSICNGALVFFHIILMFVTAPSALTSRKGVQHSNCQVELCGIFSKIKIYV